MDVPGEHAIREERLVLLGSIGGISPDAGGSVILADQNRQPCAVMGIGSAGIPGADQPAGLVDADMILVAQHRDGEIDRIGRPGIGPLPDLGLPVLDRPAGIAVLLPHFGRLPVFGHPAFLDCGLFGFGISLLGCWHDRGVDDLPTDRQIAPILERRIEASEQPVDRLGLHEPFPEQPQGRRIVYHPGESPTCQAAVRPRFPYLNAK